MTVESAERKNTWREHFPDGDLWVFGYGSLIWKSPPHFDRRVPGYINGYVRRFWQVCFFSLCFFASGDHRGTPESPGRVVTVIERSFWETLSDPQKDMESSVTSTVWGTAYHIPTSHAEEVHDYLDDREIDGYTVHYTRFYPISSNPVAPGANNFTNSAAPKSAIIDRTKRDLSCSASSPITCMVYIGLPTNPRFLSDPTERDPASVAQVISISHGKSGKNMEYLYLLEKALEGLGFGSADGHVTELVRRVKAIEQGKTEAGEKKSSTKAFFLNAEVSRLLETEPPEEFSDND
ncbi:hypothetical protein Egran_02705 [Elaphomyces granulatus]|uniref:glutathione-specific gamma-glutamylcyclotransferase n=1 Tax=Elaphomyces granulatus TaxID=519963 RepID=A0A232LZD9_9EURO|nr:hypothetical protein Egran_02705 [Elaphomyces granulatus]